MIRAFEAMREASTEDRESLWSEAKAAEAIWTRSFAGGSRSMKGHLLGMTDK
jgi:hypothetical protein